jgi:adenine-specific DNA-methyltransferase
MRVGQRQCTTGPPDVISSQNGAVPARPAPADALADRAEQRRVQARQALDQDRQSLLGQFFTPAAAAALIAGLPRLPEAGRFRVLDPGAGSGSLSAAIAARILRERPALELQLVAVELDGALAAYLGETLRDIEDAFEAAGAPATTRLIAGDYLDLATSPRGRAAGLDGPFDLVIMNPPYRKLAAAAPHRRRLARAGAECPNLYAAFLALGAEALAPGGQLAAITPRSFANGPYFGQFRRYLLDRMALDRLHVFESRSAVFSDTGVLQENVVFSGTRDGQRNEVALTVSRGHADQPSTRLVGYADVVRPGDADRFIRIPAGRADPAVAETMAALPATLADLGVQASTGRVVEFRARSGLTSAGAPGSVPLVYPGHVRGGIVQWPRDIRKAQGFAVRSAADGSLLLPEGCYVVIRRFSAKEERRRVVAAVWTPLAASGPVAFENHLNVLHCGGAGLDRDLAAGLSYWLNSSLVDTFFRTFSGHTQVNAADLRSLRFPKPAGLRSLGRDRELRLPSQEEIDRLVAEVLGLGAVTA